MGKWTMALLILSSAAFAQNRQLTCHGHDGEDLWRRTNYFVLATYTASEDADALKKRVDVQGQIRVVVTKHGEKLKDLRAPFKGTMTPKLWYGGVMHADAEFLGESDAHLVYHRQPAFLSMPMLSTKHGLDCLDEIVK